MVSIKTAETMVKVKNKKNFGLADKLHAKKSNAKQKTKLNPFEVHINKEKYKVLGKKSKNDWGLPGVSRAKAMKKRKNTIGHELKLVNKSNTFLDKRIGEKNVSLSEEDKAMQRFAAERILQHKMKSSKQSIYNLADDDILTHRGQTLEEIEKFDDPRSDDENDDEMIYSKSGNLKDSFVADVNFGGGVLSRNDPKDGPKSRKDLIEQLIVESKKRKLEKQKQKEETLDLTEKLDSEWKDLHVIVSKEFNKEAENPKTDKPVSIINKVMNEYEKKNEDYDKMMRELKFEPRGTPSDRLKSEDEIARFEKEKLEKLERDRLNRMQGMSNSDNSKSVPKHKSADDLDDNYAADSDEELALVYDAEGNAVMKDNSDEDESGTENEGGENENSENEENSGDETEDSGDESEDSLDDLKVEDEPQSSDNESNMNNGNIGTKTGISKTQETKKSNNKQLETESNDVTLNSECVSISTKKTKNKESADDKIKSDLLIRKAVMEKAAAELPYTFQMPKDYDSFYDLLNQHPPDYQSLIIERMIKCNHPKLGEENKEKLNTLFAYMLQYLNDLFSEEVVGVSENILNSFRCFDRLCSHIYDLAQMNPLNAKDCVLEVVKEKYEEYCKTPTIFPHVDCLIFFKLVSLLFPTSDLKHPVVTPCFIFMSQILSSCKVRKCSDVSKGLFITTLVLEYVSLSKRILPDAINFIRGVLFLSIPTNLGHKINVLYPFKKFGPSSNLLVVDEKQLNNEKLWTMNAFDLISYTFSDFSKISCVYTAVNLFYEFFKNADDMAAREALFKEHIALLKQIPADNYPEFIVERVSDVCKNCESEIKKQQLRPIWEHKKTKMLKLYEPAFNVEFSGRKKKNISKEKIDHEKLIHKHKKEMKGALREIRRDKAFISSVKIKEKIQSDNMRKEKVKRIYSEASIQQGELNALQRSKKKKK